jgi:hypothetical protein
MRARTALSFHYWKARLVVSSFLRNSAPCRGQKRKSKAKFSRARKIKATAKAYFRARENSEA